MRPGYTVNPEPSITHASAGMVTFLPTAVMRPSSITIVPPEIVSPVPVMMRTLRIAKWGGGRRLGEKQTRRTNHGHQAQAHEAAARPRSR